MFRALCYPFNSQYLKMSGVGSPVRLSQLFCFSYLNSTEYNSVTFVFIVLGNTSRSESEQNVGPSSSLVVIFFSLDKKLCSTLYLFTRQVYKYISRYQRLGVMD